MLVYIVMCAMFESMIYPAAILTTFMFSIFGVFWLFWLTGTTFSIMAMIGMLILMGVVVNNGIVMIVHINQLRHDGHLRDEALDPRCERAPAAGADDDGDRDSRHAAARNRRCGGLERRTAVFPDGACDRRRPHVLDDRDAARAAVHLLAARRRAHVVAPRDRAMLARARLRRPSRWRR